MSVDVQERNRLSAAVVGESAPDYKRKFSLPQYYYTSPELYRKEMEFLRSKLWLMAAHESQIPKNGDFKLFEIDGESIILCRDLQGDVHAFYNVCRHRGSPVCVTNEGNAKAFSCPYHSWTFMLDGTLKRPRAMDASFDPKEWNLKAAHLGNLDGLLFVCLAKGEAPSFEEFAGRIRPFISQYGLTKAKPVYVQDDLIVTNWKLPLENYRENYHISSVHQDLGRVMGAAMDHSNGESHAERMSRLGRSLPMVYDEAESLYLQQAIQFAFGKDQVSATQDGSAASSLMPTITEWSKGWTYINFNPLSHINLQDDYAIMVFFTPVSETVTKTSMVFLVNEDAVEGKDLDVKKLIDLYVVTMAEDNVVLGRHQKGIESGAYEPAPLALEEDQIVLFHDWYFNRVHGVPTA
ncbi:aromatic ring-hydroxylating dioxygenase subunit alpha [Sphingopyxis sp.]|uniref:aromatic ring-hydroxylating oxygenase subunit alpha n=1 Tax=Sphingopyxis sp. TaxID=1908224 RepID=UPI002D790DE1|nr:aromatic ring-hydroxylating dioxygenase subunit alpha [Sphingopyxis sp.]HET6522894.1 aromatic ring-hydroxylating dioxygenase subunit alpha [Sphingopyxis sp.]